MLVAAYLLMLAADPVLRSPEDALPPGAVARLGSVRLARPIRNAEQFFLSPDSTRAVILPSSPGFQRTPPEWWDLEKGRRVSPPFFPPMGSWFAGVTSAGIITADNRGYQLRHPKTGAILFAVPNAETTRRGGSSIPTFNHDGTIAIIRNGNRLALVRKQADGSPLRSELPISVENSWAMAHRGGAIVWSEGNEIKRYDVGTGETRLVTKLNEPLNVPAYLDIHPDGSAIIVVRRDRNYDMPPECQLFLGTNPVGKTLASPKRTDSFGRLQFSSDGSKLFTVSGNEAAVWSFETGELLFEYQSKNWNRMIVPSSDCRRLLTINSYGQMQLFDWPTGRELTPAPPSISEFKSVHWLDNRTTVGAKLETTGVASQNRGVVVRWDAKTGSDFKRFGFEDRAPWFVSTVSPGGRFVALADVEKEYHRFRVQELETGRTIGEWTDSNPNEGFIGPFSPDGKTILARKNGQTGLFTLDGQRCLVTLTMGTPQRGRRPMMPVPANAQFSSDGRLVFSTQSDAGIIAFETSTGHPRYIIPSSGSNSRFGSQFGGGGGGFGSSVVSGDGRRAIVEADGRSLILDPATGTVQRLLEISTRGRFGDIGNKALSRDGRWLAVIRSDSQDIIVYDVDASPGPEIVQTFRGMTGAVTALAFSPDDQLLVSVSTDGTAVTWDVGAAIARYRERMKGTVESDGWNELAGDSLRAGRAMAAMVERHPTRSVAVLRQRLFVPDAVDLVRVKTWIADLDAPDSAVREFAQASLRPIADQAAVELRTTLTATKSAEVRKRITELLNMVEGPETNPQRLRIRRATEVLERIGTPDAREVLSTLANGPAHAIITQEAANALKRLTK